MLPALAGLLAPVLAACGSDASGSGGDPIVVGTTDHFAANKETPAPFDPAAAYDVATWNVMRNTFQTLVRLPRSGTQPEMDAATSCGFSDAQNEQYRCKLRDGLTFSNGNELDAKDVEFSIKRVMGIKHPSGPASLFANIDRVEATGAREVVFHLKSPDATFPYKLTTPAAAIVDSETYPKDRLLKGFKVVGSGPYTLDDFDTKGDKATLARNSHYEGNLKIRNGKIEMRFFDTPEAMEKALKSSDIDLMSRSISPDQVKRLDTAADQNIKLVEQPGQEIRYLTFNTEGPTTGKKAVRKAIAEIVNRKEIVSKVYSGSAEPLYTLIPGGLPGHRNSFFNTYGEPDPGAAKTTLAEAGVDTPVKLTLTYTTDHYGSATAKEFATLKKQLNNSGLFDIDIKGVPWNKFQPRATSQKYEAYGYGWYPDFPDADNFTAPFFQKDNFLGSPYRNKTIDKIIPQTRRMTERSRAGTAFGRAQDIVARDIPVLPLWQGKQYIAARDDITGVEWALNSSSVLQFWELGRGASD
ncbi:peptide-binding protein [Streptomyces sp. SB3404]|uniref:Peptide-binding protein n=1 Tax=Streptomyces boncukensis TaxID=2711219 RepID=A0A6G4X2K5_9ACTN|nr:peptide-binding protein [Streptomyces boncukensis]